MLWSPLPVSNPRSPERVLNSQPEPTHRLETPHVVRRHREIFREARRREQ
jgi:hypothetical protein